MKHESLPEDFDGVVRLFPLPNLVMFPHVVQPLHIFEPRYRAMTASALADDQLIAVVRLLPGWEQDYDGHPPIAPTCCIGRIISHTELEDGKFNILLMGIRRGIITRELSSEEPYRQAEVEIPQQHSSELDSTRRAELQRELLRSFQRFTPETPAAREQFESLMNNQLPLEVLTDVVSFTMKFDLDFKQRLLSECDIDRRAEVLLNELRRWDGDASDDPNRDFPPPFSVN